MVTTGDGSRTRMVSHGAECGIRRIDSSSCLITPSARGVAIVIYFTDWGSDSLGCRKYVSRKRD